MEIGHDVWIGDSVTIMTGVKIGNGAVVATNSVVTSDVAPYTVVGGSPAKFIKKRFTDSEIERIEKSQWWTWPLSKIREKAKYLNSPVSNLDTLLNQ